MKAPFFRLKKSGFLYARLLASGICTWNANPGFRFLHRQTHRWPSTSVRDVAVLSPRNSYQCVFSCVRRSTASCWNPCRTTGTWTACARCGCSCGSAAGTCTETSRHSSAWDTVEISERRARPLSSSPPCKVSEMRLLFHT